MHIKNIRPAAALVATLFFAPLVASAPVVVERGVVPQIAVTFGAAGGTATPVTPTTGLPVNCLIGCSDAATAAAVAALNTTLGSPFQAGGSIGNTTFSSTQSGTWNLNNITGMVSLPTGAATSANQVTAQTSLDSIVTNTSATGTLNTNFGAQADPASTAGAASAMGYWRAMRDALYDTATASLVKISTVDAENNVDANIATAAPVRIASAAGTSDDETQVCAVACTVLRVSGYNAAASTRYIKFTNATAANTTPGTTAVYWSIPIPATSPFSVPVEQAFSTAATVYLVTGAADNDATDVTAADILGLAITSK